MQDVQFSKHSTKQEWMCKCRRTDCYMGTRKEHIHSRLLRGFEKLRVMAGKPISINSGCRCWWDNTIGLMERGNGRGHYNSQHLRGAAADLSCPAIGAVALFRLACEIPEFGGIGLAVNYIHVDIGSTARWAYPGAKLPKSCKL